MHAPVLYRSLAQSDLFTMRNCLCTGRIVLGMTSVEGIRSTETAGSGAWREHNVGQLSAQSEPDRSLLIL